MAADRLAIALKLRSARTSELFTIGLWGLRVIWTTSRELALGLVVVTVARGLVPAAIALAARGLIDASVEVMHEGTLDFYALLPWLAAGCVLTLVEVVALFANKLFTQRLEDDLNLRITADILEHASGLDLAFFEDPDQRDVIERARQNPAGRLALFFTEVQNAVTYSIQIVSLLALLATIDPLVPLVVTPFAIPFLYFQWHLSRTRYREDFTRATKHRWASYFVGRLTAPDSVAEVKLFDLGPLLIGRFRSLTAEFRNRDRRLHWRNFWGSSLSAALTITSLYVIFARVALRAIQGGVSVGDLAIFGGAAGRLRTALDLGIRSLTAAFEHALYVSNLRDFLGVRPRPRGGTATSPPLPRGEIELRNVTFTYPGSTKPALENVSLRIEPAETLAIVGESGAGKSTLVKLLARLYEPDQGEVLFDGVDLREIPLDALHRSIGFVLQSFGRYEATVADNIAYGDWRSMLGNRERIEEVAKLTNIDEMIEAMPEGFDTWLGRQFGDYDLSGGQWQRIAVARAFSRDTSLLVLDEPTSNLDTRTEFEIFSSFKELSKGRTTILISHRFSTIGMADRIVVLDSGRIVEVGTHDELVAKSGSYASLYSLYESRLPRPTRVRRGA